MQVDPIVGVSCQILTALVFGGAALHKLRDPARFVGVVREYRVLAQSVVPLACCVVVAAEGWAAAGIWIPGLRAYAAVTGVALLAGYAAVISANLARGRADIDCGCSWGRARQSLSGWLLLRNALLALPVALAGLPLRDASLGVFDVAVAVLASLAFALTYQSFNHLLANRPALRGIGG